MSERRANWVIREATPEYVILDDVGPWDRFLTITNAAEIVVQELVEHGLEGRKLYYVDSDRWLDELVHADGKFLAFSAGGPNGWPRDKFRR